MDRSLIKTQYKIVITDAYIAEAQRLTIAQNKTLKLLYQTWWFWWPPRFVLAVIAGFFLMNRDNSTAAMVGVALVLSFIGEWSGHRQLAKARARVRNKNTTTTITFTDLGIGIEGTTGSSQLKWSAMFAPTIYSNGVLVKFSRVAQMWLPDATLVEGSPADVRQLLSDHVVETAANSQKDC